MRTLFVVPTLALFALSVSGCEQYYAVDDACLESGKVSGGAFLSGINEAAMLRMNCYRRMTGLSVLSANELVQDAADGVVQYVGADPNLNNLYGKVRENAWLVQQLDGHESTFTGTNAYERLTDVDHGAGYSFYDVGGTGIWEYIRVETDTADGFTAPTGEAAVDYLMRDPVFRQLALQPSWIDGAYAELSLSPEWYGDAEWESITGGAPLPTGGRVYYMIVLYTAPHIEHTDKPVFLPRPDQTDVPLYGMSENTEGVPDVTGGYPTVHLSYPITLVNGALDPALYDPINQNQYNAEISAASIVGPDGAALETEVVHPGDEPLDVWPAGYYLRTTLAIYTREPFEPSSKYTVYADLSHPEGDFAIEYEFRTRAEDPGMDANIGRTTIPESTTAATARRMSPYRPEVTHAPPGSLGPAAAAP
jgi:hypothetical protein